MHVYACNTLTVLLLQYLLLAVIVMLERFDTIQTFSKFTRRIASVPNTCDQMLHCCDMFGLDERLLIIAKSPWGSTSLDMSTTGLLLLKQSW